MVSPTPYRAVGRGRQKGFRSHLIDTINSYRVVLSRSALSMSKTPVLTTESLKNADLASRIFSFTVSCKVSRPYAYLASICSRETFNQLQRTNTPSLGATMSFCTEARRMRDGAVLVLFVQLTKVRNECSGGWG